MTKPPPRGGGASGSPVARSRVWLAGLALLAVAAAVGAAYSLRDGSGAAEEAEVRALSAELEAKGVAPDALAWVTADDAVRAFATQAAAGATGDEEKAEAVVKAVRARAQAGAFVPWSLSEARSGAALPPAQLLPVLDKDQGRAELYPLEVAGFVVSALRQLAVPALVAELTAWPDARAPLDPGGMAGYYVVAVGERRFDVYAGRTVPESARARPLSDAQWVAAGLSLAALQSLNDESDTRRAGELADASLKLSPKSPTGRSVRGAIWAAAGSLEQALAEFEAANQLRRDAPRRYNMASAALLNMDAGRASTELNKLVTEFPEYALARVSVAALEVQRGNVEDARQQLDLAERAAPGLSAVTWARAELAAVQQDMDAALQLSQRAYDTRPTLEAHLRLARMQRQAGDLEGAVQTVRAALDMVPPYRRDELRRSLKALLGPAVMMDLENAERAEGKGEPDSVPSAGGDFDLSKGLDLLGDDARNPAPVPGLGGPGGKPDGPVLMMGDPSKLHLGGDGDRALQLDLTE